ncbi:hypothetical protein evm_013314 [Chilo suppressalis]|nr:hypothetical protein evm_013314 [Chilo suppressalis]
MFGNRTSTSRLVNRERVFFEAIPWKKRINVFEYTGPEDLIIKAIFCYDYQNSEASVNITSGGLGDNHVAIRMKSQRSYRLDYAIEIYD